MSTSGEFTLLLQEAEKGNRDAANQLFALVENDLKRIARKSKRSAGGMVEFSTTELVDDAFVRLVGVDATTWQAGSRHKFFGYAARKIHDVLIENIRSREALKRGGGHEQVEQEADVAEPNEQRMEDIQLLLDLKTALEEFEAFAPKDALLFRVRYFLGCTFEEAAEIADFSVTEAKRAFERARLWLQSALKDYGNAP